MEMNIEAGIATITLNRPPVNALNIKLFHELRQAVAELEADPAVRVLIITGAGEIGFTAGIEITEMKDLTTVGAHRFGKTTGYAIDALANMEKPTLAAVQGLVLGGGCELALACDFRLAADTAKFALPELNLGIIPGGGATQRLPRLIGLARARELLFLGEMIDAKLAAQYGLAHKVVPAAELANEAKALAGKLAAKSAYALRVLKNTVNTGLNMNLSEALDFEIKNFVLAFAGEDRQEGIGAFLEKRKPVFTGK